MTHTHHLDQATLMRFASGDLDEAFSVVVAAHVAMCRTCRLSLRDAESYGGDLLAQSDVATLDDNALEKLKARIKRSPISVSSDEAHTSKGQSSAPTPCASTPKPLYRYLNQSIHDVDWKRIAPGVRKHDIALDSKSSQKLFLLHIAEGTEVPEHGHGGAEITLVLSGAYTDRFGRFGPGDVADLDEDHEHQPKVEAGADCICLVAAEGYSKPKSLLGRLLQPFIRI